MEPNKSKEENEMVKALESIHFENENLQQCLKKIVITRRLLESKLDSVTSELSSVIEENYKLQDVNTIICARIQAMEQETNELEKSKINLTDSIKKLEAEIEEYKGKSGAKIDNLLVAADKLCSYFLFAITSDEKVEEECLMKLTEDYNKIKEKIVEKENNIMKLKREIEECDFYDYPEDPLELHVQTEEREFIMNMMENNLRNAKQQLEDLYKLKAEKEKEECAV